MRRILHLVSLVTIFTAIQGCGTTPCIPATLQFDLIGFSEAEAQPVILSRYVKGQNFSQRIDTVQLLVGYSRQNDTLRSTMSQGGPPILSAYDYEISFPSANKLYRLTDIIEVRGEKKHSVFNLKKDACINEITQLRIDNQVNQVYNGHLIYLRK